MDNRPIGVFDSGVGGLTVVNALTKAMPNEAICYVGDTARVPYGNKSKERIQEYSTQITKWLIKQNCKMIVIACNTVSSLAIDHLISSFPIPIIGVIDPGVSAAIRLSNNNKIAVLGTSATIKSNAYGKRLKTIKPKVEVISKACPLFVPLAEEGWTSGGIPLKIAEHYISYLKETDVDTIILGCTHYPLFKKTIHLIIEKKILLVDSGEATANVVFANLEQSNSLSNKNIGEINCFVTDDPFSFNDIADRFVLKNISKTTHIDL